MTLIILSLSSISGRWPRLVRPSGPTTNLAATNLSRRLVLMLSSRFALPQITNTSPMVASPPPSPSLMVPPVSSSPRSLDRWQKEGGSGSASGSLIGSAGQRKRGRRKWVEEAWERVGLGVGVGVTEVRILVHSLCLASGAKPNHKGTLLQN